MTEPTNRTEVMELTVAQTLSLPTHRADGGADAPSTAIISAVRVSRSRLTEVTDGGVMQRGELMELTELTVAQMLHPLLLVLSMSAEAD